MTAMAEFRQLSLQQLEQLLNEEDGVLTNNYISQGLALARRIEPRIVFKQFSQGPMVLPEMRVLIVRRGWTETTINLQPHRFVAGDLVFVGRNSIVQVERASDDVLGLGFSLSDELFSLAMGGSVPKAFDGHVRDFHFRLSDTDMAFLDRVHELLYENMRSNEHNPRVALHLIGAFLCHIDRLWQRHEATTLGTLSRNQRIFADFLALINREVPAHNQVNYYASQLCLSPRYFSTLIRQVSGKSSKQWIDEAMATHIKIELRYTDKTVAQISDDCNFPNPSFFCKFFKRLTGTSPNAYRATR